MAFVTMVTSYWQGGEDGTEATTEGEGVGSHGHKVFAEAAETIAVLYEHRWTIEIFFRFFKHVLGCRHLLSHDERGIEIQTSSAIIACMLISLWTGRKPSRRTYEMICYSASGLAREEELLAHSAKLPPQPPDS